MAVKFIGPPMSPQVRERIRNEAASVRRSLALFALRKFHDSFQHLILCLVQYLLQSVSAKLLFWASLLRQVPAIHVLP